MTSTVTGGTALSDTELDDLRATVRSVCADAGGTATVRRLSEHAPGVDAGLWDTLGRQVGLAALGLPEAVGGIGGLAEIAVVCEELGRTLAPVPLLSSTVLAGQVLAGCGTADEALAELAEGAVHALAVAAPDGTWRPDAVPVTVTWQGGVPVVDGTAPFVLDGGDARALVVAAAGTDGVDLFLADPGGPGVAVRRVPTLDLSRGQAVVTFSGARVRALTAGGEGAHIVSRALDVALVALAAEQLGGAQAALDMTVAHVRDRTQFGRPIGGFQAVKHTCADMLLQVEGARSAVLRAVDAAPSHRPSAEAAAVAQAWCSEAFVSVAAECVHLHGGMGFTWEHDAHLYFRRAQSDAVLLGGAAFHRERLAGLLSW
ncbi:acyl-CoA dehydrogenase family protein [Streptomyces neyagawaensis]|uniref:acyl-CoA dehydrogenase family protein n=1 Tax=Streptomyces neyagawaensis TaxID=42238 RepID=UPI0006E3B170|nr:acyl-CoA dehydrogenase family protein [Streptomyces neyagawaensis]MCL6732430.1 acyl-CoA/acyl-ACP dehydrogenase [Streptomyces neyagawaensis]MDE1685912.1 acyl-CoA/acyl-ACP dehydrogenase [Streptomyces neyagawaensis]